MVNAISSAQFHEIISSDKLTIIDFNASWCGPCQMLVPVLNQLSEEIADAGFYYCDVDKEQHLAEQNEIELVPTLMLIKSGNVVERLVGFKDYNSLRKIITAHI